MAISITYSLGRLCSGGGHADIRADITPDGIRVFHDMDADTLRAPLDREEREKFAELCIRMKMAGLTKAQARTVLQSGFTVTIE